MPNHRSRMHGAQHSRSISSYDRTLGGRQPRECILVVCEGAKTEPNYFKALRDYLKLSTVDIEIIPVAGAPITVVDQALDVKNSYKQVSHNGFEKHTYEAVWCVFDTENLDKNASFWQAVNKANSCKFSLAISNPAFEIWYVLHFEDTSRPFADGQEVKGYLKNKYIKNYEEAMNVFPIISGQTLVAIKRAEALQKHNPDVTNSFPNPSTGVFALVKALNDMNPKYPF